MRFDIFPRPTPFISRDAARARQRGRIMSCNGPALPLLARAPSVPLNFSEKSRLFSPECDYTPFWGIRIVNLDNGAVGCRLVNGWNG